MSTTNESGVSSKPACEASLTNKGKNKSQEKLHELISNLRQQVCDRFNSELGSDPYAEIVIKYFNDCQFAVYQLNRMLAYHYMIVDDERTFHYEPRLDKEGKEVIANEHEYCQDSWVPGLQLDRVREFKKLSKLPKIHMPHVVVAGPCGDSRYVSGDGSVTLAENPHIHTSQLKRALSAIIVYNDLYAMSLTNQDWLNHQGKGIPVITGAFVTHVVVDHLEQLRTLGIPLLLCTQQYTKGLHTGSQYVYKCDDNGFVVGHSRGKAAGWTDLSDPFPFMGYYEGFKVTTLAVFGPQRIVYLQPTERKFDVCVPLRLKPELNRECFVTNEPPRSPNYLLGIYDAEEEVKESGSIRQYDATTFVTSRDDEGVIDKMAEVLNEPKKHFLDVCPFVTAVAAFAFPKKIRNCMLTGSAIVVTTRLLKAYLNRKNIVLSIQPLTFYGKNGDELFSFWINNPIDSETGLPFGYYYTDGRNLIQVEQGNPSANYTNVHRLITAYVASKGWSSTVVVNVYNDAMKCTAPLITNDSYGAFQEQAASKLKAITASGKYKVELKTKHGELLHLLNMEQYRDYLIPKVDKDLLEAVASTRIARPGIQSTLSEAEHLDEYINAWEKYFPGVKFTNVCPVPDISKYKGAKYRIYHDAFVRRGAVNSRAFYNMFIKHEALPTSTVHKKGARAIQANTKSFNIENMSFFQEFEHKLLSLEIEGFKAFAKGLNFDERHEIIHGLAMRYQFAMSIDFKNFDGHHCGNAYKAEMAFYAWLGLDPEIAQKLISAPVKGEISHNINMRHSGDLFTGSGNCFVVLSLLSPFLGKDCTMFCDGDDTLLFMNSKSVFAEIERHLLTRGYELTGDAYRLRDGDNNVAYELPFCQMTYDESGFNASKDRIINKFSNLAGSNVDALTNTFIGKLQSLLVMKRFGVEINFDIQSMLYGFDKSSDLEYKEHLTTGMKYYKGGRSPVYIDINSPESGVLGDVCRYLNFYKEIFPRNITIRNKMIRLSIRHVLLKEREKQAKIPDRLVKLDKKISSMLKQLNLRAVAPILHNLYTEMIRDDHPGIKVIPIKSRSIKVVRPVRYTDLWVIQKVHRNAK